MRLLPLTELAVASIAYNLRQADREELQATMGHFDSSAIAAAAVRASLGFIAATDDGMPVAAVGAVRCWPGVWQVGMFATALWPEVALGTTRHVKRWLMPAVREAGWHRAHAFSLASHAEAHRWLFWLGARVEARLAGWGKGGEDFLLFVWRP